MISTNGRAIAYTADGVQTVFPFPYAVIDRSHLTVTVDDIESASYTVTLNADPDTGATVTFSSVPTANSTIRISRTTPATQLVDYVAQSAFNAETHENALDKLTLIAQELREDFDRAIKAPAGSTTNTRIDTSFYGNYFGFDANGDVVALDGTITGDGGSGGFDLADTSDLDTITVAAAGTTAITLPDANTTIFGAYVTANVGSGVYTHDVQLPAVGSTGMRGFVRVLINTSEPEPIIRIKDAGGTVLAQVSAQAGEFRGDFRFVSNGTSWLVDSEQFGTVCADRHTGTTHVVDTWAEFETAAADSGNSTIYILKDIFPATGDTISVAYRHKIVFAAGAKIDLINDITGATRVEINCEVITATRDQPIFRNAVPGSIIGSFGNGAVNPAWWDDKGAILSVLYPDDWFQLQAAAWACDWEPVGTSVAVTSWGASISVGNTTAFKEGDIVFFSDNGVPSGIAANRPYIVANATSSGGDFLSTFQVIAVPTFSVASPGSGGSLSVTVTRVRPKTNHRVVIRRANERPYTIDRPIDAAGTGMQLMGNGSVINAIAGEWASTQVECDFFSGGHSPMVILGDTGGGAYLSEVTQKVDGVTLNASTIAEVSCIGAKGHVGDVRISNVILKNPTRFYIGWSSGWSAVPGKAATDQGGNVVIENFDTSGIDTSGAVAALPFFLPADKAVLRNGRVVGDSAVSPVAIKGAATLNFSMENLTYSNCNTFFEFTNDALFLGASMMNVSGTISPDTVGEVSSTNTSTNTMTSTGHGLSNGDMILHNGVGTVPTGWETENAYFVINATTDTFQISDKPGGGAFGLSADNGAFNIEKPGQIVKWSSSQATAKFSGYGLSEFGRGAILLDTTTWNRAITGANDRLLTAGHRRCDVLSWSNTRVLAIADGLVRCGAVILYNATGVSDQLEIPYHSDDLGIMVFDISAGPALVVKYDEGSSKAWKTLRAEHIGSSPTWVGTTTDPEV